MTASVRSAYRRPLDQTGQDKVRAPWQVGAGACAGLRRNEEVGRGDRLRRASGLTTLADTRRAARDDKWAPWVQGPPVGDRWDAEPTGLFVYWEGGERMGGGRDA
ncbi:hypothetical protein ZWY2020_043562 [Hordeum vulgare]|nr:hypothetical protein ZWY2020_043562 [Hordeum vulgare]